MNWLYFWIGFGGMSIAQIFVWSIFKRPEHVFTQTICLIVSIMAITIILTGDK